MKSTISEMKNTREGVNSRLEKAGLNQQLRGQGKSKGWPLRPDVTEKLEGYWLQN